MSDLLIEADVLQRMPSNADLFVFDVRYSLSDPQAGRQAYLAGHIPGAYFLDQNTQLAGPCTGTNGRHPLPARETLADLLRQHGLTPHSDVIVYDDKDGSCAARAWWLLRWLGYSRVALLNGGWQAWLAAGGTQQTEVVEPLTYSHGADNIAGATMPTVSAAAILSRASGAAQTLIDARAAERYRGEVEPLDPVAGRIDGALNRPIANNVQSDGRFKPASRLRAEFSELIGNTPPEHVAHYCGSGITACHNIFSMELAGFSGSALYPGSWSEWCSDPHRPVARG